MSVYASTNVTSDITTDTRWTTSGSPYVVNFTSNPYLPRLLTVVPGATLTIDPGVVVKFGAYNGIAVNGTLRAEGTTGSPIIFTSLEDDTAGGDTNGDGAITTPTDEQWMHLQFNTGSNGAFDHAIVRYGGQTLLFAVNTGIENNGGTVTIDHTRLTHNGYDGFAQFAGIAHIAHSEFDNHTVGIRHEYPGGTLYIDTSNIHDNTYDGLLHSFGTTVITGSDIHDNGTGIVADHIGTISVHDSSIHGNGIPGNYVGFEDQSRGLAAIDATSDWWGSATGPGSTSNPSGTGDFVSDGVTFLPFLTSDPLAPSCTVNCNDNVLFLPGIEGSRLYKPDYNGGTTRLWEPMLPDHDNSQLFLDANGVPNRSDIYTKDVIDNAYAPIKGNIYSSFEDSMNNLKANGTINDWEAAPYDWRLSLDDILSNGKKFPDGRIYYSGDLAATSSPYIIQELRRLAATSKTGKVTIIAHSNGGLVAKALTEKLGSVEATKLIDKIIFVAVPQVGTPEAIGAILHGYDQGLPFDWFPLAITPQTARALAANMPSAYNLLPSQDYFTYVDNPVVTFDNSDFLAPWRARYGALIHSEDQLRNFITDTWRLASSSPSDLVYPSVGNTILLSQAEAIHTTLDNWTPPQGTSLYEIAGWGEDTLATIEYKEGKKTVCGNPQDIYTCIDIPAIEYTPRTVIDGDGTVVVPSALWTTASIMVAKYWVNLRKYNNDLPQSLLHFDRKHADILEIPSLRTLIKNILTNATSTSLDFISTSTPPTDSTKRLRFLLHSPLNLSAIDNLGNVISFATSTIPASEWKRYGEVQVLTVPKNTPLILHLDAYATGSFTLDMQEIDGNNAVIASSTLSAVPSATSTKATLALTDGTIQNASPLLLDYDGNGTTDYSLTSRIGKTTVFDITPPEAVLTLDPVAHRLSIIGTDNLSSTTVSTTATSTTITDEAGNTTQVIFKRFKQKKHEIKLELQELRYNGVSAGNLPKTMLKYEWSADKTGKIKELEEKVVIGSLKIEGHYDARKNVTKIEKKLKKKDRESDNDNEKETKETLPGLVIINLATEKGTANANY
ncbi:MAG: lipase/acyltransferase domain-containing protein [Minisyncoccota bacterium]